MADTEAEVIIKAEYHNSKADLREGRDILKQGVDHYVIEDSEEKSDYDRQSIWFQVLMWFFDLFVMNRLVYTDSSVLEDIADEQGANKVYTRTADSALIENASRVDIMTSFALFALLTTSSIAIGILFREVLFILIGILLFVLGMICPIILLRIEESNRNTNNRDQKITDEIVGATMEGGRVVAILGNKHCEPVKKKLPDEIEPNFYPTSYGRYHPRQILNNLRSLIVVVSLYTCPYLVLVYILRKSISFL